MIEVFLFGIVLGLIPIILAGLFVTAYSNLVPRQTKGQSQVDSFYGA